MNWKEAENELVWNGKVARENPISNYKSELH